MAIDEYEWKLEVKYSPDQPRVPAGSTGGGRWTSAGSLARRIAGTETTVYEAERGQKFPKEVVDGSSFVHLVLSPEGKLTAGIGDLSSHAELIGYLNDTKRYDQYVRAYVRKKLWMPRYGIDDKHEVVFDEATYSGLNTGWKAVGKMARAMVAAGFDPKLRMSYTMIGGHDIEGTLGDFTEYKSFKELVKEYNPDQPRIPAGDPRGGQWTSVGGGTAARQFKESNAQAFRKALDGNLDPKYDAFVTKYTPEEYQEMGARTYVHDDGKTGFAIKPDGDIISVFSGNGRGRLALQAAIELGGTKLDCFDGFLPGFYSTFGFEEYERWTWDDQYAPDRWNYAKLGRPDVVLMRRKAV